MKNIPHAYYLDWDPITAEGYMEKENEAILVFNFDIRTSLKTNNVIHYVVGRTIWGCKNFPGNAKIRLSFDIRGQDIIMSKSNDFKKKILDKINFFNIDNPVIVDFLR